MIQPLPHKEYKNISEVNRRVLRFDPKEVYERIEVDYYSRINRINMSEAFPQVDKKFCACGCGEKLKGRRRRWATDECQKFAYHVVSIINGHHDVIRHYLWILNDYQWCCTECGLDDYGVEQKNGVIVSGIHKDHIVAVKNGGGGCWLSNYQLLCQVCHSEKGKND